MSINSDSTPSTAKNFEMEKLSSETQSSGKKSLTTKKERKKLIQFIALSVVFTALPTVLLLLLRMITDRHISKSYLPLVAFPLQIILTAIIYPKFFKVPFGKTTAKSFYNSLGFHMRPDIVKLILLGVILGFCSLFGMFLGSLLSGKYIFSFDQLTLEQVIFSTVPGVWEEIYYRGIIMVLILYWVKDLKKAVIIQSVVFGMSHFSGISFWEIIDVISVMLIGYVFTFHVIKTNSLIPSIIFHFLHDAFIFVVQVPESVSLNWADNILFYTFLWGMLGVGCLISNILNKKGFFIEEPTLYNFTKVNLGYENQQ